MVICSAPMASYLCFVTQLPKSSHLQLYCQHMENTREENTRAKGR